MSEWRLKSESDTDKVFAEYDDNDEETGNFRYEGLPVMAFTTPSQPVIAEPVAKRNVKKVVGGGVIGAGIIGATLIVRQIIGN